MKKSEKRKLDKKIFTEVRDKGKCERCGRTMNLQCCHIFSRRYKKLRHNKLNLLCFCSGCHMWSHHNPLLFAEWVKNYLGKDKYDELLRIRNTIGSTKKN